MQREVTGYRLSPQQRRLWLLGRESRAFCVQSAFTLEGALDGDRLREAARRVAARHEILRTTLHRAPAMLFPIQVVADEAAPAWEARDLSGSGEREQEREVERMLEEARRNVSDTTRAAALALSLVKLSDTRHVLAVTVPASNADARTLRNLVREMALAYEGGAEAGDEDDEPLQYAQFSEWHNELLEAEETEEGRTFWRRQNFADLLDLSLPTEAAGGTAAERAFDAPRTFSVRLGDALSDSVDDAARQGGVETATLLMASWSALRWRLTGRAPLAVGALSEGRTFAELADACGPFARVLPVRVELDARESFRKLLARLDAARREAREWEEFFEWEQAGGGDEADGEGRPRTQPFCPFLLACEEADGPQEFGGVRITRLNHFACVERFKVQLRCERDGAGWRLHFDYDPALVTDDDARRLGAGLTALLARATADAGAALSELEVLGDEERRRLLVEWNDTASDFPRETCVHELFAAQAARTPDAAAVADGARTLSYAELDRRADELAARLRALGVGPDVLVGVLLARSSEMVVALLATLKAGGAYVPLDPSYPRERLSYIVEDSRIKVLLTSEGLRDAVGAESARVVCLDAEGGASDAGSFESNARPHEGARASEPTPDNLAYVIYTSGSTGRPKGAMITHRGLVNYLHWAAAAYRVAEAGGAPVHSPVGFDLTVTSLYLPLLTGRRVALLAEEEGVEGLYASLRGGEEFSLVKLTPAHLEMLGRMWEADADERALAGGTRALVVGGEALLARSLRVWRERAPGVRVINEYGPTETVVGCCVYEVKDGDEFADAVPIGRPISNTRLFILDGRGRPQPIGVAGELYIGGAGVARGYLNRPGLTAERFVPDPFSREPGARLYRTGDLARYRVDGEIEFLGRVDHQVKIRGFRVELGEIEAVLAQHPAVGECAVLAVDESSGSKSLVAYFAARTRPAPARPELQEFLRKGLPEHMIPAAFVTLDALPLSPNGKVNRRALAALDRSRPRSGERYVAPRNRVERVLAEAWSQVLQVERVGTNDNFFELGGDSILSIQIIAKARAEGVRLTPRQLFQHQTVAGLAAVAGEAAPVEAEQGVVVGPVPLTPIQHWFFEQELRDPHHFNQSVMLEVDASLAPEIPEQAWNHLLRRHDALRLRFERDERGWRQTNAGPESVSFARVDLSALAGDEQRAALEAEAARLQARLHLTEGPLVRVALFDLGASVGRRLIVVIHHLAVDGVSWRVLLSELDAACRQLARGEEIQLPPKTTSFKQWAERLSRHARSPELKAELEYWRGVAGANTGRLRVDRPEGGNSVASAKTVTVSLDAETTSALLVEAPKAYNTQVNDLLLTALAASLAARGGSPTLLVDLEGHGREDLFDGVDLSRTVGWFTSVFPVVLDAGASDEPGAALKAVKEHLRMIPSRGVGYGLLRYLS
ncbi:MAG TPA: amino acid adenylation domain-containing protein, partial [Pyrinomonadaceae bacterium]|nr:amino acid adenylation domain-containing protein [Pyrinomonadaceae bacterium]